MHSIERDLFTELYVQRFKLSGSNYLIPTEGGENQELWNNFYFWSFPEALIKFDFCEN